MFFFSDFSGLKSYAMVNLKVLDINDNEPELTNGSYVYVCESDKPGTVRNYLNTFHIINSIYNDFPLDRPIYFHNP